MRRFLGLFLHSFPKFFSSRKKEKAPFSKSHALVFDRAGASRQRAKRFMARWLVAAHARRRTAPPGVLHRPFYNIYDAPRFFLGRGRREEK